MVSVINRIKYNERVLSIVLGGIKVVALMLGLALISQLQVYLYIVPLTLQTSYVALTGLIFPKKISIKYLSLYIGLALFGTPVLTGMQGLSGANIVDFGFVLGFIVMACFINYVWNSIENKNFLKLVGVITLSNIVLYIVGFGWVFLLGHEVSLVIMLPFIIFDILKMTAVITLYNLITQNRS